MRFPYLSRVASICAIYCLLSIPAASQSCGPPFELPIPYPEPTATFTQQTPGEPKTCAAQVTVQIGQSYVSVMVYYPCTGQSMHYAEPLILNGNALADTLRAECGAAWQQTYFPNVGTPGFRASAVPRAAATPLPAVGQSSQGFVVADLNGDGNPDLAFVTGAGVRVQLLDASGNVLSTNTFSPGFSTAGGLQINLIAADFNGDGKPDLAITNAFGTGTSSAAVFLGNGDGTFGSPLPVNSGPGPLSLVAADFNGDGKLDLAFANQASPASASGLGPGEITVAFGKGDGTFQTPASYSIGENSIGFPDSLLAVDLNGDGSPDLAMANRNDKSVSVLINSGGVFKPVVITQVPVGVETLVYGDFNNDGKEDLLAASMVSDALVMLFGKGDGTFQTPVLTATSNQPASIGLLPLSGGDTVAITDDSVTGNPFFSIITPQGVVGAPPLNFVGGSPTGVAVADLNGDGQPDAVAVGGSSDVTVLLGNNGVFQSPVGYTLGASSRSPAAVAIGDLNGDGHPDVVTANGDGTVSALLGSANGQLGQAFNTVAVSNATGIALADFNRDGKPDAAVASYGTGSMDGGVIVLSGNGDGTFQSPLTLTANGLAAQAVAAADLNGDGIPDIAAFMQTASGQPATLAVFLGQAGGTFQTARTTTLKTLGGGQGGIAIGDFNGDGKPDIAAFGNYNGQIDVLLGDGTGAFHETAATPVSTAASAAALAVADVNSDGAPDLITTGSFLLGNGDGTFQPEQQFLTAASPRGIAPAKMLKNVEIVSVGQARTLVGAWIVQPSAVAATLNVASDVSSANLTLTTVAPASIATLFGSNLATGTATAVGSLPDSLGGATATVVDSAGVSRPAPLFYASPTQINYYVPDGTATGNATVTVSAGGLSGSITTPVAAVAPGIFELNTSGLVAAIVVDVAPGGAQSFTNVYQVNAAQNVVPLPVDLSSGQVYLELYGTGIRNATNVTVSVGGVSVPVLSSGAQGGDFGLDQINVGPLPQTLQGTGQVNVAVTVNGQAANLTNITLK